MAVASYVDKFRDEFVAHLDGGGCPFDDSPLEGVLAPIAQHAHADRARGGAWREGGPELVTLTSTASRSRCRRAPGSSRRRSRPGSRSPSSATSRGSGRRSAPAACASARWRPGRRSRRPPARSPPPRAWRSRPRCTSEMAAEAQNATLEFILVNHPLDCPVCDKGGECPLQDLTFRYGPGNTRMQFPKRTFEKPIPISPTIALDRERCILCYRCTRFSEIGRRGRPARRGQPRLAVDDRHLRGRAVPRAVLRQRDRALPGRRAHLDAVPLRGAAVGDPERARPSAATARSAATSARRRARARSSGSSPATTPRSTRAGSATRAASRSRHLRADDRIEDPLRKAGTRRFEPLGWDDALDEAERHAARGRAPRS